MRALDAYLAAFDDAWSHEWESLAAVLSAVTSTAPPAMTSRASSARTVLSWTLRPSEAPIAALVASGTASELLANDVVKHLYL